MATVTLSAKTDLTYEEIYEGYANGKSRLPKILKDVEDGTNTLAESTGINILRRRTGGGNSQSATGIGIDNTTVVAKLISAARWDSLVAGYVGPGDPYVNPPSANIQTVNVRAVVKNPFDLIDQVAGTNNAEQTGNSAQGTALTGREAKLQEKGTGVRIRNIDIRAGGATADIDVQEFFTNDRIGGGGATGEIHGVDQSIPEVLAANSEARTLADSGASFDMTADTTLTITVDGISVPIVFAAGTQSIQTLANTINAAVDATVGVPEGSPPGDSVAILESATQLALHSRPRGSLGAITITEANSVLGLTTGGADDSVGATVGGVVDVFAQQVVDLDAVRAPNARTTLRYGTVQFGVLEIVGTTNGLTAAAPIAYILHPDHLDDLILFQ